MIDNIEDMKAEIVNLDIEKKRFKVRFYDIPERYYGAKVWWFVEGITEQYTGGKSREVVLIESFPDIDECISSYIDGYYWDETLLVHGISGFSEFKRGLNYNIYFNIVTQDFIEPFGPLNLIFKTSADYVADLPLTIEQVAIGSTDAYFECDFKDLYPGNPTNNEYSTICIYSDTDDVVVKEFLYEDIASNLNIIEINERKIKWQMLVGSQFNKSYGFYIRAMTHTRPSLEYEWGSPEATHTASYSDVVYITLRLEEVPECYLPVLYQDVDAYDWFKAEVIGVIKDYPVIRAEDWNQFCKDINTIRRNVRPIPLSEWWFAEVKSGEKMQALYLSEVYNAIRDMCPSGIIKPPVLDTPLISGSEASGTAIGKFITSLIQTAQACRDYYWGIS